MEKMLSYLIEAHQIQDIDDLTVNKLNIYIQITKHNAIHKNYNVLFRCLKPSLDKNPNKSKQDTVITMRKKLVQETIFSYAEQ